MKGTVQLLTTTRLPRQQPCQSPLLDHRLLPAETAPMQHSLCRQAKGLPAGLRGAGTLVLQSCAGLVHNGKRADSQEWEKCGKFAPSENGKKIAENTPKNGKSGQFSFFSVFFPIFSIGANFPRFSHFSPFFFVWPVFDCVPDPHDCYFSVF